MNEIANLFGSAEQLWQYIRTYAAKGGREATRTILELFYVVKSPNTPASDKTIIMAALVYLLIPNDKIVREEKYRWLGALGKGVAVALACSRVKTRVTPQIRAQVNAILEQWFGSGQQPIEIVSDTPLLPDTNNGVEVTHLSPRIITQTTPSDKPTHPSVGSDTSLGGYADEEDVVID